MKNDLRKCYICRTQDSNDNLIRKVVKHDENGNDKLIRYYHELCIELKNNKSKLNKNIKYDNESIEHFKGKKLLMEYLLRIK